MVSILWPGLPGGLPVTYASRFPSADHTRRIPGPAAVVTRTRVVPCEILNPDIRVPPHAIDSLARQPSAVWRKTQPILRFALLRVKVLTIPVDGAQARPQTARVTA
jgi:hypothetical protein